MKLMTVELRARIPKLYSQEHVKDPIVYAKFFGGACTWLVLEFDGEDEMFGWADLGMGPGCAELGYFSLAEIQSLRFPPFGLPPERDLYWKPVPLSVAKRNP